ncbi:hypothetical protein ACLOJK_022873 [Asimina triloba]
MACINWCSIADYSDGLLLSNGDGKMGLDGGWLLLACEQSWIACHWFGLLPSSCVMEETSCRTMPLLWLATSPNLEGVLAVDIPHRQFWGRCRDGQRTRRTSLPSVEMRSEMGCGRGKFGIVLSSPIYWTTWIIRAAHPRCCFSSVVR